MQKRLNLGLLGTMFVLAASLASADTSARVAQTLADGGVLLVHTWETADDTSLMAVILAESEKPRTGAFRFAIYRGKSAIISTSSFLTPLSMFSTSELDPKLVVIWISGDGTYRVEIYLYSHHEVIKVLDCESKMMPEFVYSSDYRKGQLLIVSHLDWRVEPQTGRRVFVPVTADIYGWNGKGYEIRRTIPWDQRLREIK